MALGLQRFHFVDTLGRTQFGHLDRVGPLRGQHVSRWLHGRGEGGPGGLLRGAQFELRFEQGLALFHPGLHSGRVHAHAAMHSVLALHAAE